MAITLRSSSPGLRFSSAGIQERPLLIVRVIVNDAPGWSRQITSSGFITSNPVRAFEMSAAVNSSLPDTVMVVFSFSVSSTICLRSTFLRLRMMFVTSSITPGMVSNSCLTPSILIDEIAYPSREERSTRRRALPTVMP